MKQMSLEQMSSIHGGGWEATLCGVGIGVNGAFVGYTFALAGATAGFGLGLALFYVGVAAVVCFNAS